MNKNENYLIIKSDNYSALVDSNANCFQRFKLLIKMKDIIYFTFNKFWLIKNQLFN